jgi:hypothetical protein
MQTIVKNAIPINENKSELGETRPLSEFDTIEITQTEKRFSKPTSDIDTNVFYSPSRKKEKFRLSQNFR